LGCSDGKIKGLSCGNMEEGEKNMFEGPEGFLYRWYLPSDPDNTLSEERVFSVEANDTLTYYLDVIQPTNKQCYYTLHASAVARFPLAGAEHKVEVGNCQNAVRFTNNSSIVRVNQVSGEVTQTSEPCDTYLWDFGDGSISVDENPKHVFPDEGGSYTVSLKSFIAGGKCFDDTTFVVTLPKIGAIQDTTYATVCFGEPYMLNGSPIFVAGTYSDTLLNEYGCEVISTLNLNVLPKPETHYKYDTICSHEEYIFGDRVIKETGVYRDTIKTVNGCDSISILDLLVNESLFIDFDSTVWVCEDDDNLIIPYSVLSGNFLSCDVDMKMVTNNVSYISASEVIPQPDALVVPIPDSIVPGVYNLNLKFGKTSCGLEAVDLPIEVHYSKQVLAQRWNDVLAVKNEKYNHVWNDNDTSGYQFVAFQWYKNGQPIEGATSSILYEPDGLDLDAEYSVLLTRLPDNVSIMSCVADLKDLAADEHDKVVVFEKDKVMSVLAPKAANVRVWTSTGILVKSVDVQEGENLISTLGMSGVYILDFLFEDGTREIEQVVFE
jgi:hypothetical protein